MKTVRRLAGILFACSLICLHPGSYCFAEMRDMPIHELEIQALEGDANAQFSLALKYRYHSENKANQKKARYWAEQAAEQNHVEAQGLCAALYLQRASGPVSIWKSLYWYLVAASRWNNQL